MNATSNSSVNGRSPVKQIFFGWMVLVLLLSSGCNLPNTTPTPTVAPTESPLALTALAKPLPAAVVETDPLPESSLAADGALTVYFNQSMDRASVEAALHTTPPLNGKFDWPDDSTVRFTPDQPLPAGTAVTLIVNDAAKASNGLPMSESVSYEFQTSPDLAVTERLPRPESTAVDSTSAIVASFNLPVAALSESNSEPLPFSIEPAVEGSGEWVNTSTYIFYPQPALQGGVTYTVTLDGGLKSQAGSGFTPDAELAWSFTTATPGLANLEPAGGSEIGLDQEFKLTFNQPVDRASIEGAFQFAPDGGSAIAGSFTWSDDSTVLTFKPDDLLARDTAYSLRLSQGATGLGGTPLDQAVQADYRSVPNFTVVKTDPIQDGNLKVYSGYGNLSLTFSSPPALDQNFKELVKFNPPAGEVYFYPYQDTLSVNGYFAPSSDFSLTLSAELKDQWGMPLGEDYVLNFNTKDSQPLLTIPMAQSTGSRVLFLTPEDTILPANATNLMTLDVRSAKMDIENFIAASLGNVEPSMESHWQQAVNLEVNRNQVIGIELTPEGQSLAPGLYAFTVDSPQLTAKSTEIPFLLVSSNIQMTLKESVDELVVWAVDTHSNQPVSNLDVRVFNQNQAVVGSGTTDVNGLATIAIPADRQFYEYLYAVSGQPGDANFSMSVTNWSAGINSWEYGIPTSMEQPKPKIYLYSDRPIYRPGQTVYLRGIVRTPDNGRYELPPEGEYTVSMVGEYDELTGIAATIDRQSKALTAFGTFSMTFTLPENAKPGYYHFEVAGGDAYLYFQVASYRKPEMEVKVAFDQSDALNGATLNALIDASYYFGAPAGNLHVNWTLMRRDTGFYLPGGYQVGPVDTGWLNRSYYYPFYSTQVVLSGEGATDATGKLALTFSPDQLTALDPVKLHALTLEVTITDPSNQPVSGRGSMRLLPAEYAIGVRPEVWSSQAGDELGFSILTTDWNQQPKGGISLTADFQKITWVQSFSPESGGMTSTPEYTSVGSTDFTTGADGQARVAFTPQDPGIYQLDVSNGNAVTQVWV
ncbi:hypothetical protein FDZ74_01265, partial [bacterium]